MRRKDLHDRKKDVILSVGDIIVDASVDSIGILLSRVRHIDMIEDDFYVWEIRWIRHDNPYHETPFITHLEEEELKASIVVGMREWHSVNGGTFEL